MSPMVDEGNQDESLVRLGELARRAWPDAAPAAVSANGKRQLKAAAGRARAAAPKRWVTLGLACSAIVALGVALFRYWPSSLDYSVESPSPSAGGYLQATKQAPAVAHFTDGTDVRIDRGARARIVDVDRNGARVALEQGHARLRVAHRPSARWSVDAGPFSIAVTGTDFDVDWSSSDGVLVVELRAGGVIVRGPLAADGIGVHAGQRLVASLTESRLHIEAVGAARASASEPPTPAPDVAAMVPTATDRDAPAPPVERAVPPVSWPKRDSGAGTAQRPRRSGRCGALHWKARHCARGADRPAESLPRLDRCQSSRVPSRTSRGRPRRGRRGAVVVRAVSIGSPEGSVRR